MVPAVPEEGLEVGVETVEPLPPITPSEYSFFCVAAPATPSALRPFAFWNDLTAAVVAESNSPVATVRKFSATRRRCISST